MFFLSVCLNVTSTSCSLKLFINSVLSCLDYKAGLLTHPFTLSDQTGCSTNSFLFVMFWVWGSTEVSRGFPQFLLENSLVVRRLWNDFFLPNPFQFIFSYTIEHLALIASLNNSQKWFQTQDIGKQSSLRLLLFLSFPSSSPFIPKSYSLPSSPLLPFFLRLLDPYILLFNVPTYKIVLSGYQRV
jgi:hypothetical protein